MGSCHFAVGIFGGGVVGGGVYEIIQKYMKSGKFGALGVDITVRVFVFYNSLLSSLELRFVVYE